MLQYWMLKAGFGCLRCMGGSRKFCLGVGCPENFILVFSQRAVRTWPPFRSIGPKGSYFFLRLSITVILRKNITPCDLSGGMQTLCPHHRDTHMRCLANNLNSVARSVAYLLNMQTDRRSHPVYFSWIIVSSPDDSRRPSCKLLV